MESMTYEPYPQYPQEPVDNLALYAGYWPVRLAPDAATPPFAQSAGAATAAPKQTPPP